MNSFDSENIRIVSINGYEMIDSRGFPTVKIKVHLSNGKTFFTAAPGGTSVGIDEKRELRDHDLKRFHGRGVTKALRLIEGVAPMFDGHLVTQIDQIRDQLEFQNLPSNVSTPLSILCEKIGSYAHGFHLYEDRTGAFVPNFCPGLQVNVVNGGSHVGKPNTLQEFMFDIRCKTMEDSVRAMCELYEELRLILRNAGLSTGVGLEGGFLLPESFDERSTLLLLQDLIERSGYTVDQEISLALDCAASSFYNDRKYHLRSLKELRSLAAGEMVDEYRTMIDTFSICSIEDPFAARDFEGWNELRKTIDPRIDLIGDDLFCSSRELLDRHQALANGIILKPNQIGTLRELEDTIHLASSLEYRKIFSHRSGETEDSAAADLAVRYGCDKIKFGAPRGSERTGKYNRLIEIFQNHGAPTD